VWEAARGGRRRRNEPSHRAPIDMKWVHTELRKPGVFLCAEHQEAVIAYNAWRKTLASSMRQVHRAGEKLFVDYSGKRPRIRSADGRRAVGFARGTQAHQCRGAQVETAAPTTMPSS
jgi:hypothetical protein